MLQCSGSSVGLGSHATDIAAALQLPFLVRALQASEWPHCRNSVPVTAQARRRDVCGRCGAAIGRRHGRRLRQRLQLVRLAKPSQAAVSTHSAAHPTVGDCRRLVVPTVRLLAAACRQPVPRVLNLDLFSSHVQ